MWSNRFSRSRVSRYGPNRNSSGLSARALLGYVEDWYPANPRVSHILEKLAYDGAYDDKPEALLEHIKKDIALFGRALRRIQTMTNTQDDGRSPMDRFASLNPDQIRMLLTVEPQKFSKYKHSERSATTVTMTNYVIATCIASEAMARTVGIDPNLAFCCCYLRNLSLILYSWNFDKVSALLISRVRRGHTTPQRELEDTAGCSSLWMAETVAREWKMAQAFRNGLSVRTAVNLMLSDEDLQLGKICRLAEQVGLIAGGVVLPRTAVNNTVKERVEEVLGVGVFSYLIEQIQQRAEFIEDPPRKRY